VQWPDVIVLDVEMPKMDGITFLRKIMAERPAGGDLLHPDRKRCADVGGSAERRRGGHHHQAAAGPQAVPA
jgi:CheY-like chemotaxis protein